jgi:hypothetical protein
MPTGVELIAEERNRQVEKEGWTPEHDKQHRDGELAVAGASYAVYHTDAQVLDSTLDNAWPWDEKWWKPSKDPIRNLVKAGALIAAEIDRINDMQKLMGNKNLTTGPMDQTYFDGVFKQAARDAENK